ncbi:MAG TPA: SRPBCC family protein [Allosphingosinicella sp.]|uniref:SRPBCC family protein n=1 Tax=Allosphingosinicella sp. TaxID=2823234 RepID=UPI002ED86B17
MNVATSEYGVITEAGAIRFERLLPGPIERVWEYLVDGEKRSRWLASGPMDLRPGGDMELVWRNGELAAGEPIPEKYTSHAGEHRMKGKVLRVEPPRLLVHSWDKDAEVVYELEERGDKVLLTLTNRKLPNRGTVVDVAGGWHTHLEMLAARLEGRDPPLFWDTVERVEREYEARILAE